MYETNWLNDVIDIQNENVTKYETSTKQSNETCGELQKLCLWEFGALTH